MIKYSISRKNSYFKQHTVFSNQVDLDLYFDLIDDRALVLPGDVKACHPDNEIVHLFKGANLAEIDPSQREKLTTFYIWPDVSANQISLIPKDKEIVLVAGLDESILANMHNRTLTISSYTKRETLDVLSRLIKNGLSVNIRPIGPDHVSSQMEVFLRGLQKIIVCRHLDKGLLKRLLRTSSSRVYIQEGHLPRAITNLIPPVAKGRDQARLLTISRRKSAYNHVDITHKIQIAPQLMCPLSALNRAMTLEMFRHDVVGFALRENRASEIKDFVEFAQKNGAVFFISADQKAVKFLCPPSNRSVLWGKCEQELKALFERGFKLVSLFPTCDINDLRNFNKVLDVAIKLGKCTFCDLFTLLDSFREEKKQAASVQLFQSPSTQKRELELDQLPPKKRFCKMYKALSGPSQ